MIRSILGGFLAAGLLASPALAQSASGTWNGLPDRFQVDAGYFRVKADTVLRYNGDDVNFEQDLGVDKDTDTFWIDGTWRVGRRHQVKLGYTRFSRARGDFPLQRPITWGGKEFSVGFNIDAHTGSDLLGGYYRFAVVRNDRFEIGPAVGIGHLSLNARINVTASASAAAGSASRDFDVTASKGSITGAVGAYASGWAAKRLLIHGDFLYIKVSPGNSEASVTDWRVGADYYFLRNAGLGVQYKYDRFEYDRGVLSTNLGGQVTYQGGQVFVSFRF